jgi:hypothetical protein
MPDTQWEDAAKEAFASAKKNLVPLEAIQISHPTGGDFYFVKNKAALTLTLEDLSTVEHEPIPFTLNRPTQGESGAQELSFSVSNIDRRVSDFITSIKNSQEPAVIKWRFYLSDDLTTPMRTNPLVLTIESISVGLLSVTGRARFMDVLNRPYPNEIYNRQRYPSLS